MLATIVRENLLQMDVPSSTDEADAEQTIDVMSKALPTIWQLMSQYQSPFHQDLFNGTSNSSLEPFNNISSTSSSLSTAIPSSSSSSLLASSTTTTSATVLSSTTDFNTSLLNATLAEGDDGSTCSPTNSFVLALPWIRITFGLLMVGENTLSLLALWYVKRMQTAIHRFISSLAVAELFTGMWCCYRYSAEILMASDSLTFECHLRYVGITYLNFVAILSVCALCLDRCIALHFPFRYVELVTKKRVRVALVAIWFLPVLFVLTAYLDTQDTCAECSFIHIASQRTYMVLTVVRCVFIAVIIVSELLIFRSARCQIVKIYPNVFSTRNSNRFLKMNAKAAITTLTVVVPFLLLYFPVLLVQGNLAVRPYMADSCQGQLLAFVWLFASAHGIFTPFIFCWRFTEVRQNLVRLLCCARTQSAPQSGIFHMRTTNDSAMTV